jgi:peptidoglycan L-alanyl-D-glutamate endopeptidase CwlK
MKEEEIIAELHPDLQKVIAEADKMCEIPFTVVEGKRSKIRQELLWYKGEDFTDQKIRSLGCAVTICATLEDIPCFSTDIYMEVADSFRFAGSNNNIKVSWGGAADTNGLIDISADTDRLMADIYEDCYNIMLKAGEEINPRLQHFELYYEK